MDILTGMRTFVAVVTAGSFTGAAERLGISKSLASKYVGQLEQHLGSRLLNRTTRQLNVTEVGSGYQQYCVRILEDIDELEAAICNQQSAPRGRLLVTAPTTFGELYLAGAATEFLEQYPEVSIEMVLSDHFVNIIDEGFDLAIRIGALEGSSLIARRLAPCRLVACAAPAYLNKRGMPQHPAELDSHRCIIDTNFRSPDNWSFMDSGRRIHVKVNSRLRVNGVIAVREAMLSGYGIGLTLAYAIGRHLREGRLQSVLEEYELPDYGIYAVYPHDRYLAAKVRTFVEFLMHRLDTASDGDVADFSG